MPKRRKVARKGPKPGQEPVIRGDRVVALREKAGKTQAALAFEAELSLSQLQSVERGTRDVQCRGLRRLVLALGTTADYLLGLDDE